MIREQGKIVVHMLNFPGINYHRNEVGKANWLLMMARSSKRRGTQNGSKT